MKLSQSEQYMNMAIESTLRASSASEAGDQASEQCNPGLAQQFYDDMRVHEQEAVKFERLSKECK